MNTIQNYFLEVVAFSATLYIFYLFFLSKDTFYARNRIYLIASVLISLILPALNISIGAGLISSLQEDISRIIPLGSVDITTSNASQKIEIHPILAIYLFGISISTVLILMNIVKIFRMIKKGRVGKTRIVMCDDTGVSGFSAFGFIFLSKRLDNSELEKITKHELQHIDNLHFIDLLLMKLVSIVLWFNPFIYLFERSLKAVHEYQADQKLIMDGEEIISYQRLLLNQIFRTKVFTVQNAFAGKTLIKKRIIMMTKQKTPYRAVLKLLLVLPVITFLAIMFSCSKEESQALDTEVLEEIEIVNELAKENANSSVSMDTKINREVFVVVEKMPTFQGGDINYFRNWVQMNVTYPKIAIENGIQGKVFASFVVNEDGSVSNIDILKGVDPSLDNQVIETIEKSPEWKAGTQRKVKVPVKFAITVNFALE